jgi:8-oxo-dGTP pyrophosphatase MutT (NUDIX family)
MRRIAVRAIIADGDKLLLVKLKTENGTLGYYCTIGGGLDDSEGLLDGVKREVLEETGVVAQVGRLLCIQQYTDKHDNVEFFFHVTNTDDFKNINLIETSHGEIEIAEIGFFNPKELTVLPEFLKELSVEELINSKEVQIFNYF